MRHSILLFSTKEWSSTLKLNCRKKERQHESGQFFLLPLAFECERMTACLSIDYQKRSLSWRASLWKLFPGNYERSYIYPVMKASKESILKIGRSMMCNFDSEWRTKHTVKPYKALQTDGSKTPCLVWWEEELTMARECWRPMIVATRKESLSFLPKKGGKGRSCLQGGEGMHRNFHW